MVKKIPIDTYTIVKKLPQKISLLEDYDESMASDDYLELLGQSKNQPLNINSADN